MLRLTLGWGAGLSFCVTTKLCKAQLCAREKASRRGQPLQAEASSCPGQESRGLCPLLSHWPLVLCSHTRCLCFCSQEHRPSPPACPCLGARGHLPAQQRQHRKTWGEQGPLSPQQSPPQAGLQSGVPPVCVLAPFITAGPGDMGWGGYRRPRNRRNGCGVEDEVIV